VQESHAEFQLLKQHCQVVALPACRSKNDALLLGSLGELSFESIDQVVLFNGIGDQEERLVEAFNCFREIFRLVYRDEGWRLLSEDEV